MMFETVGDLWRMPWQGMAHGVFVWSVYGIATVLLAWLALAPWWARWRWQREWMQQQLRANVSNNSNNAIDTSTERS
jgi:heme exporter protein CcmD